MAESLETEQARKQGHRDSSDPPASLTTGHPKLAVPMGTGAQIKRRYVGHVAGTVICFGEGLSSPVVGNCC